MENNKLPYHIKPGFKVPNDYFGDFEERLMYSVKQENKQPEILNTYAGKPGFSIPEGYFDTLESEILNKAEAKTGKVIPLFSYRKIFYAAAVAAVFIGILSTLFFKNSTTVHTLDSLELSALENYIEEGYFDLDYNELSAFMTEDGYSFDNYSTSEFSDEAVYNYINENIEDPEFLFE
ncbi:MAG TPA: hypothetical protein VLN46_06570 [Gillisia sp.]|nr:hypothetical protein [Gillisia sp.]